MTVVGGFHWLDFHSAHCIDNDVGFHRGYINRRRTQALWSQCSYICLIRFVVYRDIKRKRVFRLRSFWQDNHSIIQCAIGTIDTHPDLNVTRKWDIRIIVLFLRMFRQRRHSLLYIPSHTCRSATMDHSRIHGFHASTMQLWIHIYIYILHIYAIYICNISIYLFL